MLVNCDKDVQRMLSALDGLVSYDIEGTCLYPWQKQSGRKSKKTGEFVWKDDPAKITMFGFGTSKGEFSVPADIRGSPWKHDEWVDILAECADELEECFVTMHNGKFDVVFTWARTGIRVPLNFDTFLADYMCDENRRHGLDECAARELGVKVYDLPLAEKQGKFGLTQNLITYHGKDLKYTRNLYKPLRRQLDEDPQTALLFDRLMMPLSSLYSEAQYDGIVIDSAKFDEAEEYLRSEKQECLDKLSKWSKLVKITDKKGRPVEFNWGSTAHLGKLLFEHLKIKPPMKSPKTGKPSTKESALNMIDHACISDLIKFRGAKQQLSFFIDGWKPYIHRKRVNGVWLDYLHPTMKLHGTVTGRPSSEFPNLFQVPRDPRIRSLICAEPGWTFVECDLSQVEMRLAAELSGDPELMHAFTHGIDVHWLTAIREIERGMGLVDLVLDTARTWKQNKKLNYAQSIQMLLKMGPDAAVEINPAWKEYRKKAKAVNFGYLYGMWWKKFKQYARDNYGVEITDEQAEASRIYYFQTYRRLESWHARQKRYARNNGYVRSLSGRKRRLPDAQLYGDDWETNGKRSAAERQAINSPVQSFANEINFMAAVQLRGEYGRDVVKIVGTVYDAILMRVRDDYVEEVTERCLEIVKRPVLFDVFDIALKVPMVGEAKVGPWGSGKDFHKWQKDRNSTRSGSTRRRRAGISSEALRPSRPTSFKPSSTKASRLVRTG